MKGHSLRHLVLYRKLRVYETLFHLNRGFEIVLINLERLVRLGGFPRQYLTAYSHQLQELRALTNEELTDTLNQRELEDAYHYERLRKRFEKKLKDPNDVFIEAAHRRIELERQGKKAPDYYHAILRRQKKEKAARQKKKG